MTEEEPIEAYDFDAIADRAEQRRQRENSVYGPSNCVFETILRLQCAWTSVIDELKAMLYFDLGAEKAAKRDQPNDAPIVRNEDVGKEAARLARRRGITYWDENIDSWFRPKAKSVSDLRNRFAHMLYVESVSGDYPHRDVAYAAIPRHESLRFREGWSSQKVERLTVLESDIHAAQSDCRLLLSELFRLQNALSVSYEKDGRFTDSVHYGPVTKIRCCVRASTSADSAAAGLDPLPRESDRGSNGGEEPVEKLL